MLEIKREGVLLEATDFKFENQAVLNPTIYQEGFSPKEDYEKMGDVSNIVFPTGTAIFKKRLYIYYGAADKRIAVVSCNLKALLKKLIKSRSKFNIDIGFLAGEIFRKALRKEITLEQLEVDYKDKRELLLMAIGWLAREEKVIIRRENGELKIWTGNI